MKKKRGKKGLLLGRNKYISNFNINLIWIEFCKIKKCICKTWIFPYKKFIICFPDFRHKYT